LFSEKGLMTSTGILQQLEFDKLLMIIAGFAHSPATEAAVAELAPLRGREEIACRQQQIGDILRLYSEGISLDIFQFADLGALFSRLRPEGALLEGIELAGFIPLFEVIDSVTAQLGQREDVPALSALSEGLGSFPDMLKLLRRSVDSQGEILDSASPTLAGIRSNTRRLEAKIRKKLEDMTRSEEVAVFLQDDFVTTRSGRWVIPVRMDSKGQVAGVVHDVSKSGETAFVEPVAIISLSNELENLNAEQKAEEIRILRNISGRLRERISEIEGSFRALVYLDTINCIACLAIQQRMAIPEINKTGHISIINGRHPLLAIAFEKHGGSRQVVPLTVRLGGDDTIMVITGSNAGGKTISIKTIGLLAIMALSGMPIPADSASSIPLINEFLIDIGDEQSIENDLSTFSAHIGHIAEILKKADRNALVLLDELGTGTDPVEGAAIACAVLNEIRERGALLFATTHLMDIKGFVHRTPGMLNASMEFDQNTLTPLYRLRLGEPGQSYAIEIAKRYGLPDSIIDAAKRLLGGVKVEFDNLIRDLTEKRAYYEKAVEEVGRREKAVAEEEERLERSRMSLQQERDSVLAKAYGEATDLASGVKREMHELLEAAKKAERAQIRESIKKVEEKQKEFETAAAEFAPEEQALLSIDDISVGDIVHIRTIDAEAEVVEINKRHDRIKVKRGGVEVEVPFAGISRSKAKAGRGDKVRERFSADTESADTSINIIGRRVDDALMEVEPFLNHAALAGIRQVSIIHGIGTGVLMQAVKEHLKGHPLVENFRSEEQHKGGWGVTVVLLK
jgi:DNA mismatch repair protein MutS2